MARIVGVETFFTGDVALVRVRTEDGHQGWGQVAPYHADITALVLHRQVAPHVLGQDDGDLIALGERVMERERVAVFGCGGVGLNAVQGARLAGASRIVAIDLTEEKLGLARRFGATDVVHAGQEDPARAIHRLMGGVDYAFEVAGREQAVQHAWSSLDVGGEAVVVGLMPQRATVTLSAGGFVSEQVIRGCYFGSAHLQRDVPALVGDYLAGNLLLDELITRRIGLEELNDAFDALRAGEGARSVLVLG